MTDYLELNAVLHLYTEVIAQRDRSVVQLIELFNLLLSHVVRLHP